MKVWERPNQTVVDWQLKARKAWHLSRLRVNVESRSEIGYRFSGSGLEKCLENNIFCSGFWEPCGKTLHIYRDTFTQICLKTTLKVQMSVKIRPSNRPKITLAHICVLVVYTRLKQNKMGLVCLRNRSLFSNASQVAATCSRDMSPLLFPMCVRAVILSLLHVSTTRARNMLLRVCGTWVCRCYMSLGHIPATFPYACACFDSVPATCLCYTCPQHAPSCAQNVILLPLHVPGTGPSCVTTLKPWINYLF